MAVAGASLKPVVVLALGIANLIGKKKNKKTILNFILK
jgi:hypothetical protein